MNRVISTSEYGICIYSKDVLQNFIKKEKIRTKKLLQLFQKNKKKYLRLQQEGIWIPFVPIDSVKYYIMIENQGDVFGDEWEKKFEYEGFNLNIENGIWISDIASFHKYEAENYEGEGRESITPYGAIEYFSDKEIWYTTLDGKKIYSDFWYDIPSGNYLLTIKGYARKDIVDHKAVNYGFQFEFKEVHEFDGYKNPREEQYNFNVASMK